MKTNEQVLNKKFNNITKKVFIAIAICAIILIATIAGIFISYNSFTSSYYYAEGVKETQKGNIYEAKNYLNMAMEEDPGGFKAKKAKHYLKTRLPKSDDISEQAIILHKKGVEAWKASKIEKARQYFLESIEESPEFDWPYYKIGHIYLFDDNNIDLAIKYIEQAKQINPDLYSARLYLAKAYLEKGRVLKKEEKYKDAIKYMKKSIREYEVAQNLEPEDKFITQDIEEAKDYINLIKKKFNTSK
ncbi:MAG: hypothetical protein AB1782_16820 [Cyanobacteriota bacterium]